MYMSRMESSFAPSPKRRRDARGQARPCRMRSMTSNSASASAERRAPASINSSVPPVTSRSRQQRDDRRLAEGSPSAGHSERLSPTDWSPPRVMPMSRAKKVLVLMPPPVEPGRRADKHQRHHHQQSRLGKTARAAQVEKPAVRAETLWNSAAERRNIARSATRSSAPPTVRTALTLSTTLACME